MLKDSFDFKLDTPFDYHSKGEKKEARLLVCSAPTAKQNRFRVKLKQGFFNAIQSIESKGKGEQQGGDTEPTGAEIITLLYSSNIDMADYLDTFKALLTSGVCQVEGEETLNSLLFDSIDPDDVDKLCGDYLAFFIISSALRTLNSK